MNPIFTFTANLLAETTYTLPPWEPGQTRRALEESFQVGGKGINVSKMLRRLGGETKAICFPGGPAGQFCQEWLREKSIPIEANTHACHTRLGTVVRSDNQPETTFLGLDSIVSKAAVEQAMLFLASINTPFVFAISGSIQNWDNGCWNPLRSWLENRGANTILAIDTYGAPLEWIARQEPDCIKINRDELALLIPDKSLSTSDKITAANERYPCPLWIITEGSRETWVKHGELEPKAYLPPAINCVSPTGCGDVFFATLLNGLYQKEEYSLNHLIIQCLEYASRNATLPGIAEFEL